MLSISYIFNLLIAWKEFCLLASSAIVDNILKLYFIKYNTNDHNINYGFNGYKELTLPFMKEICGKEKKDLQKL